MLAAIQVLRLNFFTVTFVSGQWARAEFSPSIHQRQSLVSTDENSDTGEAMSRVGGQWCSLGSGSHRRRSRTSLRG